MRKETCLAFRQVFMVAISALVFCHPGTNAQSVEAPKRPSKHPSKQDRCQGKPIGASCWMELSNQTGCYVWDSYLIPDETKTWMGECVGGLAHGSGTLVESSGRGHRTLESTGRFFQGKRQGLWVALDELGNVHEGPFVEGKRHGNWSVRRPDGIVSGGPFVEGKAHGQWVLRDKDGSIQVGPMVNGTMHGRWVERWTDDRGVQEGSYLAGKRHGNWVELWADGSVQQGPYLMGQHHGRWVLRDKDGNQEVVTFKNGERVG